MFPWYLYFLEEISSLSHSIVFLYLFAWIIEEGFLISPCYSLELCLQIDISFLFTLPFISLFSVICKASSDNLSLNLAIKSLWSEPQSVPPLVFADSIEFLHLWLQRNNQTDFSIDHLVMSMCRAVSCVVRRGCLLWLVRSLVKTLLAFDLLPILLQGQTCLLLQVSPDLLLLHSSPLWWQGHLFLMLVVESLVGLHRTVQLQLLRH